MKKIINILPLSAFLLCGCGHPAWKDVNKEDALAIIKKIKENYKMPTFYSAKDKEGKVTFGFDDNQMFLGQTNPITGTKLYYVVGEDKNLYRLTETFERSKIQLTSDEKAKEFWDENKNEYLMKEDFAYTLFDEITMSEYMAKVEQIRKEHSDHPDDWAYCTFQSYDDSSIKCEMMIRVDEKNATEYAITLENNLPSFVSQKFTKNGETVENALTYDYKSSVTIPTEADPGTWEN